MPKLARTSMLLAFVGMTAFGLGWWSGQRTDAVITEIADDEATPDEQSIAPSPRTELDLQRKVEILSDQLARQRQLLRPGALSADGQSLDEMLALFPAKFPIGDWSPAEGVFEDCWFESPDGLKLHGWYLRHEQPQSALLHVHGNAGNVTHRARLALLLHQRFHASVLIFDYRGYGRSEGTPTIAGLLDDARAARDYLAIREALPQESIVLMGESLGGAVAVQLAAQDGARALILQSTFASLRDAAAAHYPRMLVNLLVQNELDSAEAIKNYHAPLLQIHGDADQIVPFKSGQTLFAAANEPKTFIRIPDGDHNDALNEAAVQAIGKLLESLKPESRL